MEKLQIVQSQPPTSETKEREDKLSTELEENLIRRDLIWRQKSRELWLKDGDRNSKFFHLSTVIRRRSNHIAAIKEDNGEWSQDRERIGNYFLKNFQDLFSTSLPAFPNDLEGPISRTITDSKNDGLIQTPDDKEIMMALNSIPSLKDPRPDGILSLFYKHYGETVKSLLLSAVKHFFTSSHILKEWNNTFICLIPKCQGASTFKDFRPISLCNVCYKVISKIIANRPKPLLDKIISPNQTTFVEGKWINENGLLAQEILHTLKKMKARRGCIGMKIDFSKAFNKLEWSFITKILEELGFHTTFISWIYQCISTSTFSVLLNSLPQGHFSPSRGQEINCSKSGLFFSKNSSADTRRIAKDILGMLYHKPSPNLSIEPDLELKVRNLMLFHPKRWNYPLLTTLVEQGMVENILEIHLAQEDYEDAANWTPNASRKHSVKSFYLTDQQHRFQSNNEIVWKAIWNLKIHERFKLHLWRIASECLPWFSKESAPCPLCQTNSDSVDNLFRYCIFYRVAWRESPWDLQATVIPCTTTKDLINFVACPPNSLLANLDDKSSFSLYAAIVLYQLWITRNDVLHAGILGDLQQTIKKIKSCFKEHNERSRSSKKQQGCSSTPSLQLKPSQEPSGPNWSIINTDASWNINTSCLSGVLLHPNGLPTLSWFQISRDDKPLQAEARATLLALSIVVERGLNKIWLRSDALLLVEAILHPHSSPWEIRSIISDIRFALSRFSDWENEESVVERLTKLSKC
ncbi:hypothetical protein CRG98_013457 [Punica granatum]|uniref:Reverse transcriptase domain-containing protein n=1 Tax=Punica granatum TaxID=22663 RepID=A0A2I0KC98_PUNGR|nr:hypothetical protein CRG98_013457 [Punica granatum]